MHKSLAFAKFTINKMQEQTIQNVTINAAAALINFNIAFFVCSLFIWRN